MSRYDADLQAAVDVTSMAHDTGTSADLVQHLRDQLAERDISTDDQGWLDRTVAGVEGDRNYMIESEPDDFVPRRER